MLQKCYTNVTQCPEPYENFKFQHPFQKRTHNDVNSHDRQFWLFPAYVVMPNGKRGVRLKVK